MRDLMELRDFNYTSRPSSLLFPRISVFPSCLCASFEHRFFSSRLLFVSDEEETVFVITDWRRAGKTSWFASLKRWNINPGERERDLFEFPLFSGEIDLFVRRWVLLCLERKIRVKKEIENFYQGEINRQNFGNVKIMEL